MSVEINIPNLDNVPGLPDVLKRAVRQLGMYIQSLFAVALTSQTAAGGDLTGTYPDPKLIAVGTAGTYTKVTTDANGRVTAGATLTTADLPAAAIVQIYDLNIGTQSSTVGPATITIPAHGGAYTIGVPIATNTGTGHVTLAVSWTQSGVLQTITTSALSLTGATFTFVYPMSVDAGTNVTYTFTFGAGSGSYNARVTVTGEH